MIVHFKLNDRVTLDIEGKTQTDIVEQIAAATEVFDNLTCQANGSKDVVFVVREVDDNKFYEMRDRKEGYRLPLHCHKKGGTLYVQKKSKEGKWLDNGGWEKYQKPEGVAAVS